MSEEKSGFTDAEKPNVLISRTDLLEEFLTKMTESPESAQLIETLHITYDPQLSLIANEALQNTDVQWKPRVFEKLKKIKRLDTLDEGELDCFKDSVRNWLQPESLMLEHGNVLPNILLYSSHKVTLILNSATKKKYKFGLDQFTWSTSILTKLKSITCSNINFKVEKKDLVIDEDNVIENIDISLGNTVASPTTMLNNIVSSYHKNIKSIRLVTGDRKDKWLPFNGDLNDLEEISTFGDNHIKVDALKSLEISNFGYMINTARFIDELVKAKCELKELTLLGCVYGRSVLYTITNFFNHSMESLTLTTEYFCDVCDLKRMTKLRKLSYAWENMEEKVDILKMLMMVPNLSSLEIGYSRFHGDIVNNVINFDSYSNLTSLSLHHLNMTGSELSKIREQLPNLRDLFFKSCKFGKSRTENEATLDLENYTLDNLVLDSCSLFFSKKEGKNKRLITKFKFGILQSDPYVIGHDETMEGKVWAEGNHFTYETSKPNGFALLINITSIKKFSCDKSFDEHISFALENEVEPELGVDDDQSLEVSSEEDEERNQSDSATSDGDSVEETELMNDVDSAKQEAVKENIDVEEEVGEGEMDEEDVDGEVEGDEVDEEVEEEVEEVGQIEEIEEIIEDDTDSDENAEVSIISANKEVKKDSELFQEAMVDEDDFGFDLNDNLVYSENEEDEITNSEHEDDISFTTASQMSQIKAKKQTYSDMDYCSDDDSGNSSSDTEYRRGLRRSTREVKQITVKSLRKRTRSYIEFEDESSGEDGDDPIDDDLIKRLVNNVKKYRAVIRLKAKPMHFDFERSPSL